MSNTRDGWDLAAYSRPYQSTDVRFIGRTQEDPVTVPDHLARPLLELLITALADARRNGGGAPLTPELHRFLDALSAAAHGGGPESPPPEPGTVDGAMTATEVAAALGCSGQWARHLLRSGRIVGRRTAAGWLTTTAALDAYRTRE